MAGKLPFLHRLREGCWGFASVPAAVSSIDFKEALPQLFLAGHNSAGRFQVGDGGTPINHPPTPLALLRLPDRSQ